MVLRLFNPSGENENRPVALPIVIFIGLAVIGTISSWLSILISISLAANIAIWFFCLVYAFIDRNFLGKVVKEAFNALKGLPPIVIASVAVLIIMILIETSFYMPKNYDTALYHAQAIRWIEGFPAIPGLGNLHMRFAYNSSWFPLSAFFSMKFLSGISFHCLNGFILVISVLYFSGGSSQLIAGKNSRSSWLSLLLLPFSIALYLNFSSSPGTDTPATLFIWVISVLFLEYSENHEKASIFPIILLSAYTLTVKLAALPIALISLYFIVLFFAKGVGKKIPLIYCLAFIIILLPWFIRNYIISGYLVYPVVSTGFIPSDWKMPPSILAADTAGIREWSFTRPPGMPLFIYLYDWLSRLRPVFKAVFFPAISVFAISAFYIIYRSIKKRECIVKFNGLMDPGLILLYTSIAGVIFLFLSAPDFRYGASFFLLIPLYISATAIKLFFLGKNTSSPAFIVLLLFILVTPLYEAFLFNRYFQQSRDVPMYTPEEPRVLTGRLILPAPYFYKPENTLPNILKPDFIIYSVKGWERCWYYPFPAVPVIYKGLTMRGKDFRDGFKIVSAKPRE